MITEFKNYYLVLEALLVKELKLKMRYRFKFIFSIITPLLGFIIPFLIFRKLFQAIGNQSYGIWTPQNYIIFILTGVFVVLIFRFTEIYGKSLMEEKFWKTLQGMFLSPITIPTLLLGKLLSELIILVVPLGLIFLFCFIIAQSSFVSIIFVLLIFLSSCFLMASIGLAIGSFRLSVESSYAIFFTIFKFFLIFSCYKYPKEFFPENLQLFILFNPFFYYWDMIRCILIFGFDYVFLNPTFLVHFIVILISTIAAPILSIKFFEFIYRKYGIAGY